VGSFSHPERFWRVRFVDTRAMNTVLLVKWCYKLDRGENNMALEVLRNKYLKGAVFVRARLRMDPNSGKV
jgi:hypothetical protein